MPLNEKEFQNDCAHLEISNIKGLESGEEYLCKGRVHSSCPKSCESYIKEKTIEILEK